MAINKNSDAALEVSDQAEYNKSMAEALKLDVTVRPTLPKGNLMGFATLKINDAFVVEDFKVLQSDKGLFVGMPSKPDKNSKNGTGYRDTAKPITKEFRAALTEAVTEAYHAAVEKLQTRSAALPDGEKKQTFKQQYNKAAKQAAEHNAALPPKEKGGKNKNAEL